jgi:purine-cytosine permease-like protein
MKVQRWLSYLLVPLFIIMAILVANKVHLGSISHGGSWAVFMASLALVISAGGLSWANTGSDYSRYLPSNASAKKIFLSASFGGMVPAVLLEVLGAAIASVIKNASDPISGLPSVLPSWVAVPYLIVAILTLLGVNTIDLYSSGLTLQSIGLKLNRWTCVVLDLVIATVVGGITIFSSNFNHLYSNFLSLLIVFLAPWLAIYLVDWLMRRGKYDAQGLVNTSSASRYYGTAGFNFAGLLAQFLGMAAACTWIYSPAFVGPLSSRTSGSDFSFFMGFIVAGIVYALLGRGAVKRELASTAN